MTATPLALRPPAVAGMFYPGQEMVLRQTLDTLLAGVSGPGFGRCPKAVIAPHAGYVYSGATAAAIYRRLAPWRGQIRRVVLLGPTHRVAVNGLARPDVAGFSTPLGVVGLDLPGLVALDRFPQVVVSNAAHQQEHSLEVHLPFLQAVLGDFTLLPLAVGQATPEAVAEVLEALWGGPETLIVVSSDLSHFLPYDAARARDAATCQAILARQPRVVPEEACGAFPINGLLLAAQRRGLHPELVAACNSGDTAGDKQRVVGYAGFAFFEGEPANQNPAAPDLGATLLTIARWAIEDRLGLAQNREVPNFDALHQPGATFVTLTRQGQLRGCIGSLAAHRPLLQDVRDNAVAAASRDPRFAPISAEEWPSIRVEVSLLEPAQPLSFRDEADALAQLQPGQDGLIFSAQGRRSTFLPQVWEQLPTPRQFLNQLKQKAGLPADYWGPDVVLERYRVRKWKEA